MATDATVQRRNAKEQWLSDSPAHHKWLRQRETGTLTQWRKHEMAVIMVKELKALGLYRPSTVASDICAAMRHTALQFAPESSQTATAEIEVILARKGVDRASVINQLQS